MTTTCDRPPAAGFTPESYVSPKRDLLEARETHFLLSEMKVAGSFEAYRSFRDQVLLGHLPMVKRLARRLSKNPSLRDDLESEGAREMLTAIGRFKPESGAPFQAYAYVCVRGRMLDALAETEVMGIAGNAARNLRLLRTTMAAEGASSHAASPKRLSEASGVPPRAIRRLRPFVDRVSLDAAADGAGDRSTPLGESARIDPTFGDEPANAADCLQLAEDLTVLGRALQALSWKDRFVLERLYGLGGSPPLTQTDLAGIMGISRQRVSQIAARALKQLKAHGWVGG
jgi:RNA polymerase sigma factor (sigma-70 family)